MNYRPMGRAGIEVSLSCPFAVVFGAGGRTDRDGSIQGMTLVQMANPEGGSVLPIWCRGAMLTADR